MQKWPRKQDIEATHRCWPRTGKGPSEILKRGQKYDVLQFMTNPKNRYKYAQNAMQNKGQNGDKEATDTCWSQTGKGPSTMLNRGPKYDFLQFSTRSKTVCKYA